VGELAAIRKQKQNLELPSNQHTSPFIVLNSINDEVLIQAAKDLEIQLAIDDEGMAK
jgi:hypothetical protein